MTAKTITEDYVAELCYRIGEGEQPKKNTEISAKEFVRRMLPQVKIFLSRGFTYKEIAEFIGHVSAAELKKAVSRDMSEKKDQPAKCTEKKAPVKAVAPTSVAKPAALKAEQPVKVQPTA